MSPRPAVARLFEAESVAIVGLSRSERSLARRCLRNLRAKGFTGQIFGVTPSSSEIEGVQCAAKLSDIDAAVDLAIVLRPPNETIEHVRDAATARVPWVIAAGSGFEGDASLTERLLASANDQVGLLGPNTEGMWDLSHDLVVSFGSVAAGPLKDGPAAVISQSGGIGAAMARILNVTGVGCRLFVSTGNEANLSFGEILEYVVGRDDIALVSLFVEDLGDLRRVRDTLKVASTKGVLVAAMLAGKTAAGAAAAASHSGRMSGAYQVTSSVLELAGGITLGSLAELGNLARAWRTGRPIAGRGLGIVAVSGGTRALIADALESEARHLRLAQFSPVTVDRLRSILPAYAVVENPVDVTGAVLSEPELLDSSVRAVAADPDVGGVLIQLGNTALNDLPDWVARSDRQFDVPVWISALWHPELELKIAEIPSLPEPALAVRAIDALAVRATPSRHRDIGSVLGEQSPPPSTWMEAAAMLDVRGVATPLTWPVNSPPALALPSVPAIVKTGNLGIHHKVRQGGVVFGVSDVEGVADAADAIRSRLGDQADPVIVQEFVPHDLEFIVAVHSASNYRYAVVGAGGGATERLRDVAALLLPCSVDELEAALSSTRIGMAVDLEGRHALAAAVRAVADLHSVLQCRELEINPLIVRGGSPVALDVLIR